ncbi:hypothetical protein [Affinirhizobium pseudoryzae]|uniref:hypothetical protein n=1 Tax=Allorhizobium pseudoryzae TaxID=379684 RepID=UPI0013EA718A|nr:hypothetical protein [Allorhizobium pseudoryzae]
MITPTMQAFEQSALQAKADVAAAGDDLSEDGPASDPPVFVGSDETGIYALPLGDPASKPAHSALFRFDSAQS